MNTARRTFSVHTSRRVLAALLLAASLCVLAGCSWFAPPREVSDESEQLAAQIRQIDGVTDVDVEVNSRDARDHPRDWVFVFRINAADAGSIETVPSAVQAITETASGYGVSVALTVPASQSVASVVLRDLNATTIEAAVELRNLPEVAAVSVGASYPGTTVVKSDDASLAETAASVRAVTGFGADQSLTGNDPLHSITVEWEGSSPSSSNSVEIGVTGPSSPVLDALDRLSASSTVNRIYAREGDMSGFPSNRPAIDIDAGDPADVVTLLSETADPAAEAGVRPRTGFRATTGMSSAARDPSGYVGLPIGSDEPMDLPAPPEQTDPTTSDPTIVDGPPAEWVPSTDPDELAQLDTLAVDVENFLHTAEATSGVTAEFTTNVAPCETSQGGSTITAYVVLPIFEIADSADDAFAAIVSDWERTGLNRADRALGLDIYSNPAADATIATATIRGTTEGINIGVTSRCV